MITYFVLKDDVGKTAGCVRLESGRARSSCPCTLLLENGMALALTADETPLPARPLGAAVLRGDALMAWGTAPGVKLPGSELLYRLRQGKTPAPEPVPEPEPIPEPASIPVVEPEPEPKPTAEPAPEPMPEPEPVSQPAPAPAVEPDRAPQPEPAVEPVPEPEPQPEAAPGPADSAAAAADFGLLVRHAGEVYEDILHPPLPEAPPPEDPTSEEIERQNVQAGKESWFSEAERLIAQTRRPAWGRRHN